MKGNKGERGLSGAPGEMGPRGSKGDKGEAGEFYFEFKILNSFFYRVVRSLFKEKRILSLIFVGKKF